MSDKSTKVLELEARIVYLEERLSWLLKDYKQFSEAIASVLNKWSLDFERFAKLINKNMQNMHKDVKILVLDYEARENAYINELFEAVKETQKYPM